MLPQLFGVHLDHSGKAKIVVGDDIDPAVAFNALTDAATALRAKCRRPRCSR